VRHPFFETTVPAVFAHRGGSALAPENTVAAFDRAVALGVDGLELDVRLSRDGVAIVHHDAHLDRTTDARGPVEALTAAELARVDAGCRCPGPRQGAAWSSDVGVPGLARVLERYPHHRCIIELKLDSDRLVREVVELVRGAHAEARVCLGSVSWAALRRVRQLAPDIATSAARAEVRWSLYRSWLAWPIAGAPYGGYQVPERSGWTTIVSPRFVAHAHRAGLRVQVWTVDEEDAARRLLSWGVDALITDRPDRIGAIVRAARPRCPISP